MCPAKESLTSVRYQDETYDKYPTADRNDGIRMDDNERPHQGLVFV